MKELWKESPTEEEKVKIVAICALCSFPWIQAFICGLHKSFRINTTLTCECAGKTKYSVSLWLGVYQLPLEKGHSMNWPVRFNDVWVLGRKGLCVEDRRKWKSYFQVLYKSLNSWLQAIFSLQVLIFFFPLSFRFQLATL